VQQQVVLTQQCGPRWGLFTFGNSGHLGHGVQQHDLVPRLVQALAGKK